MWTFPCPCGILTAEQLRKKAKAMRRPDTGKRAAAAGVLSAIVLAAVCIAFAYAVDFLTGGDYFIGKSATAEAVNGIPFPAVIISGGLVAAAMTVLFLCRRTFELWGMYLSVSISTYIALLVVLFLCLLSGLLDNSPLNRFDFLFYSVIVFPVGAGGGVAVCFLLQIVRRIKENMRARKTVK